MLGPGAEQKLKQQKARPDATARKAVGSSQKGGVSILRPKCIWNG